MRRPSARMLPNTATISPVVWSQDAAGARQPSWPAAGSPILCSVQQVTNSTEGGVGRQQAIGEFRVYFADDPGVGIRDRITWVDGANAILTVLGTGNAAGRGRTWVVNCEQVT